MATDLRYVKQVKGEFIIRDLDMEDHITRYIQDCDADELARIAGECFGGYCLTDGDDYNFTPNGSYAGEFGEWVDPEPWRKEQVWELKKARAICRMLAKTKDTRAIRILRFDKDENDVLTINDICEFDSMIIARRYTYGDGIDWYLKEWCKADALFSFETVNKYN